MADKDVTFPGFSRFTFFLPENVWIFTNILGLKKDIRGKTSTSLQGTKLIASYQMLTGVLILKLFHTVTGVSTFVTLALF